MCYKDEDEKLWQEDPYEYIRMKFSKYSNSPVWILSLEISLACHCVKRVNLFNEVGTSCKTYIKTEYNDLQIQNTPQRQDI